MTPIAKAIAFLAFAALPATAYAQSQPPVQSAQDQTCRDEARSRVMGGQVPAGMDMRAAGEGFYNDCMRRSRGSAAKAGGSKGKAATKAKKSKRKS